VASIAKPRRSLGIHAGRPRIQRMVLLPWLRFFFAVTGNETKLSLRQEFGRNAKQPQAAPAKPTRWRRERGARSPLLHNQAVLSDKR
jgi:hypothetical protein